MHTNVKDSSGHLFLRGLWLCANAASLPLMPSYRCDFDWFTLLAWILKLSSERLAGLRINPTKCLVDLVPSAFAYKVGVTQSFHGNTCRLAKPFFVTFLWRFRLTCQRRRPSMLPHMYMIAPAAVIAAMTGTFLSIFTFSNLRASRLRSNKAHAKPTLFNKSDKYALTR
jgi:hypothetical protein